MDGDPHSALPSIDRPSRWGTVVRAVAGLRRKSSHGLGVEGHSMVRALFAFMNCRKHSKVAAWTPAGSSAIE